MRINGSDIVAEEVVYGIEYDEWVMQAEDMTDAYKTASLTGGKVVAKKRYETDWAVVE